MGLGHFGSGFLGCEHLLDAGTVLVSLMLPGVDFLFEKLAVVDPLVETLSS